MNLDPEPHPAGSRFSDNYNQQHKKQGHHDPADILDTADTVITDSRCHKEEQEMPEHRLRRRADKCLKILRCVEGGSIAYNILDDPASNDTVVGQNQNAAATPNTPAILALGWISPYACTDRGVSFCPATSPAS